ncbi:pseudo histidine-containing phosphotransfer protein 6-like isoform X1 [Primulina eburnea]|uniref:pseudo histidine-containing phosphotransfer protein 6-like isoform X1 n=1 Tax=Primulina eburnea TaxID=1245227 RepID=UPI003C6BEAE4
MLGLNEELLRADMNRLLNLLFHQGVLDEQFLQLQQLQDESSPDFVSEVVNIYFHETEKLLRNLRELLVDIELLDYKKIGIHLNQLVGSSSSIGAKRVRNVCVAFRAISQQNNRPGLFPLCALENTPIIKYHLPELYISLHFSYHERWCSTRVRFLFWQLHTLSERTDTLMIWYCQVFESIGNFGTRVLLPQEQTA